MKDAREGLRTILVLAAGGLLASLAFEGRCAEPVPRIGFLGMDSTMQAERVEAFREGLRALGYVDGKNIVIVYRWAEGKMELLPQIASELVADKVSVIVTAAPPAVLAARRATTTIPIVMFINNPVEQGLAASLAHPGGNVTGIAFQNAELTTKRLSLLRDAVPGLQRIAILWNNEGGANYALQAVESAAKALGVQTKAFEVHDAAEIAPTIKSAKVWGAQGLIELASPFFTLNRKLLVEQLSANRMPASCTLREYVVDGCLMAYGPDYNAMIGQLASFVVRILKGANPADLAIEQPREFMLVINKQAADLLGLRIPKSLELQMSEPFL